MELKAENAALRAIVAERDREMTEMGRMHRAEIKAERRERAKPPQKPTLAATVTLLNSLDVTLNRSKGDAGTCTRIFADWLPITFDPSDPGSVYHSMTATNDKHFKALVSSEQSEKSHLEGAHGIITVLAGKGPYWGLCNVVKTGAQDVRNKVAGFIEAVKQAVINAIDNGHPETGALVWIKAELMQITVLYLDGTAKTWDGVGAFDPRTAKHTIVVCPTSYNTINKRILEAFKRCGPQCFSVVSFDEGDKGFKNNFDICADECAPPVLTYRFCTHRHQHLPSGIVQLSVTDAACTMHACTMHACTMHACTMHACTMHASIII
jgi:hypothetical protein